MSDKNANIEQEQEKKEEWFSLEDSIWYWLRKSAEQKERTRKIYHKKMCNKVTHLLTEILRYNMT